MRTFISFLLALALLVPTTYAKDNLVEQIKDSVGILYSQDATGSMRMHCTVTAFEKTKVTDPATKVSTTTGYNFVTAAHCIGDDNVSKEKSADTKSTPFFITFDESPNKTFYKAAPVLVGYQSRGEDFAEFHVATDKEWPTVPLGNEKKADDGDKVINVSAPMGLGKQVFHGTIASVYLDRPIVEGTINWKGSMTIAIFGINGGSSGSAIVHEGQKAIVGILVGTIGGTTITAIPVSRFHAVRKAVAEGKYKYYQPTVQENPDGSKAEE